MGQNVRSGRALIDPWWSLQADQALQALEAEFDPPSQTIECENIGGCKLCRLERGHQDHPIRGVERSLGKLMASALRGPTRLASRLDSSLRRFSDRDQTQGERPAVFALYPYRSIDQPAGCRLAQFGDEIDRLAFAIEPVRALP